MEVDGDLLSGFGIGRVFKESRSTINSIDFHRTSELLVSGGDDDAIRLFDAATGAPHAALASRKYGVACVRFTHDPSSVAYGSAKGADWALRYHDLHANRYVRYLHGHAGPLTSLHVAPAGDGLLSASSADGTARLWDLRSPACEAVLRAPQARGLAACYDDQGLVFAIAEGTQPSAAGPGSDPGAAAGVGAGARGRADAGGVKLYDIREFARGPFATFRVPGGIGAGLAWERTVAGAGSDQGSGETGGGGDAASVPGEPAAASVDAGASRPGADAAASAPPRPPAAPFVRFSADGSRLVTLFDGALTVLDAFEGEPLAAFRVAAPRSKTRTVAFAPNGRHVLAGCDDRSIRVWAVDGPENANAAANGAETKHDTAEGGAGDARREPPPGPAGTPGDGGAASSPAASARGDDPLARLPIATLTGHAGVPLVLAWSPRKALFASACTAVALWIPDPTAQRTRIRGEGPHAEGAAAGPQPIAVR